MVIFRPQSRQQGAHHHVDNHQPERGEAHQRETHYGARVDRHVERFGDILFGSNGCSCIALCSDHHADIAGRNRDCCPEQKRDRGIDTLAVIRRVGVVNQDGNNCGKHHHKDRKELVFLL